MRGGVCGRLEIGGMQGYFLVGRRALRHCKWCGLGQVGGKCEKNSGCGDSAWECRVLTGASRREL